MFGIGMGPSNEEKGAYQSLYGTSGTAANMGMGDLSASTDFMKAILSGDPAKIGQVLGPQIRAVKEQGQQAKQTAAEFGNRSGGGNARMQRIDDTTRSNINDMIASLTGSAVSGLNSTGGSLLGMGMNGFGTSFDMAKTMQDQRAAKWNDIFSSAASIATGVLGGLPGNPGGFLDIASNTTGAMS